MDARGMNPLLSFHPDCDQQRMDSVLSAAALWEANTPEFILQTSGSTGAPKTFVVQRTHVWASIQATALAFGLQPGMRTALAMEVAGTAGRLMLWRALALGMNLQVLPVVRDPKWEGNLDFLAVVPQQAIALTSSAYARVKTVLLGGASLTALQESALLSRVRGTGVLLYHGFGMTETLTHIALRRLGETTDYTCLPGVKVEQLGEALVIDSPERGVHSLQTEDAVAVHSSTSFRWLGRLDGAILSAGKKIFPASIEAALASVYPDHPEGFAGCIPHEAWGEALVWFSVPLQEEERRKLKDAFQTFPAWRRPKECKEGPLPLTSSGKWKRRP